MRKPAKVRFVGNQNDYKLGCSDSSYMYCRDCGIANCTNVTSYDFIEGRVYNAYFLEYWQGTRDSLHVKGETNKITDFNPLSDFEIIEDTDNVLHQKEAIVQCITHNYDNKILTITYGKEYKAIGYDLYGLYLVMDDSLDCYFYLPDYFRVISDPHQILNPSVSPPIYSYDENNNLNGL